MNKAKQFIVNLVAFLCYWLGVDLLFYYLNRNAKRIITFHDVLPDELFDRRGNGVGCSASNFRYVVDEIAKRYRFSIDVFDAATVTITFDDGFINQYEVAAEILKEKSIPAIIFVTGDLVDADIYHSLPNALITHWCAYVPNEILYARVGKPNREACLKQLNDSIKAENSLESRRRHLQLLNSIWPISSMFNFLGNEYCRLRFSGIKRSQLDELRRSDWLVGWHTKSHLKLSRLNDVEVVRQLAAPTEYKRVVFSYPYGNETAVDERIVSLVSKMDYPCAVSNVSSKSRLTGKYYMPRMSLSANRYRLNFKLCGLEDFFKTGCLLPVVKNI